MSDNENYGNKKKDHICLIIDDSFGSRHLRKDGKISNLSTIFRHYFISMIVCSHTYTNVSLDLRKQLDMLCVFKLNDWKEVQEISYSEADFLTP